MPGTGETLLFCVVKARLPRFSSGFLPSLVLISNRGYALAGCSATQPSGDDRVVAQTGSNYEGTPK